MEKLNKINIYSAVGLFLAVIIISVFGGGSVFADNSKTTVFSGGDGSEQYPYIISNAADMQKLSDDANGTPEFINKGYFYELKNDIVPGIDFKGIGSDTTSFSGTFNGQGFSITPPKDISIFNSAEGTIKNLGTNSTTAAIVDKAGTNGVSIISCLSKSKYVLEGEDTATLSKYNYYLSEDYTDAYRKTKDYIGDLNNGLPSEIYCGFTYTGSIPTLCNSANKKERTIITYIRVIDVGLTEPVAGQIPKNATVTSESGGVKVAKTEWKSSSNNGWNQPSPFQEKTTYTVSIKVEAADGYRFVTGDATPPGTIRVQPDAAFDTSNIFADKKTIILKKSMETKALPPIVNLGSDTTVNVEFLAEDKAEQWFSDTIDVTIKQSEESMADFPILKEDFAISSSASSIVPISSALVQAFEPTSTAVPNNKIRVEIQKKITVKTAYVFYQGKSLGRITINKTDATPPKAGKITFPKDKITDISAVMTWTKAGGMSRNGITYNIYMSEDDDVTSLEGCLVANPIAQVKDSLSYTFSGLKTKTKYNFAIIAEDDKGQQAYYSAVSITTTDLTEAAAPVIKTDVKDVKEIKNDQNVYVYMSTKTRGGKIYYTLDGSTPTVEEGYLYRGNFLLNTTDIKGETFKIQAITVANGKKDSKITAFELKFPPFSEADIAAPEIKTNIKDAKVIKNKQPVDVTITTETKDAVIYVTIDGTTPTIKSYKYLDTFRIGTRDEKGETIKVQAVAIKDGTKSSKVTSLEVKFDALKEEDILPVNGTMDLEKSTWTSVANQLDNMSSGTLTVLAGEKTKIPKEVFKAFKGKDVNLNIDMEDSGWLINGEDVTSSKMDADVGANSGFTLEKVDKKFTDQVKNANYKMQLELAHNGKFPFTGTLSVMVDRSSSGKFANLFYADEKKGLLTFEQSVKIEKDGYANFNFSHASKYIITITNNTVENINAGEAVIEKQNVIIQQNHWKNILIIVSVILIVNILIFYREKIIRK